MPLKKQGQPHRLEKQGVVPFLFAATVLRRADSCFSSGAVAFSFTSCSFSCFFSSTSRSVRAWQRSITKVTKGQ